MVLDSMAPSVYRAFLSVPNIALESSMACRVYRAVYLGTIRPTTSATSRSFLTTIEPRMPPGTRYEDGTRAWHAIRPQLHDNSGSTPIRITVATESFREDMNGNKGSCLPDKD